MVSKKVYSATVTLLAADNKFDAAGFARIFERNIRHGLADVFVLGAMGERGCFDVSIRYHIIPGARINF